MATTQQEVKALKEDIAHLKDLFAEAEETAGDGLSRSLRMTRREMRALARQAGKNARAYLHETGEQLAHGKAVTEDSIRAHPFASAATAFAGGVLFALLWRGR